jgi:hypothetical protein
MAAVTTLRVGRFVRMICFCWGRRLGGLFFFGEANDKKHPSLDILRGHYVYYTARVKGR